MDVHLIAVQAKMAPAHYRTAGAFRNKILELTERATAGLDDAPKLVAFPETIGFPLLLALGEELPPFATVREAVLFHFRRSWRDLVRLMLTCGLTPWQALYRMRALDAFLTYRDVMSEAALSSGVTIVAGTSFLPDMDEEPSRGLHVTGRRTYNVAYTFGPTGSILSRTRKINL
ncbi:MAG TPA: hypothetical protein VF171_07540, partial [Trueperaceae bacterium]